MDKMDYIVSSLTWEKKLKYMEYEERIYFILHISWMLEEKSRLF